MSDAVEIRPVAMVRVIHRPDFGLQAVQIEVMCPAGVTSVTSTSRGHLSPDVRVSSLIATACFEHEARCGGCNLTEVYQQAQVDLRVAPSEAWETRRELRRRRRLLGQWS
jgi:hypothetical protein